MAEIMDGTKSMMCPPMQSRSELTMGDIKSNFKKDFLDEIEDCNKYLDMAMVAENAGSSELTHGLYAVAWDEYTHARFIHDWLVDWGCEISEKEAMKWHELKERVQRKFHKK